MKELKAYYKAIEDLANIFCKKYFGEDCYDPEDWVGGDIGGILNVGDYFFNMSDIEEALKFKASRKELFGFYDYRLEIALGEKETPAVNFKNYLKYYRGFRGA